MTHKNIILLAIIVGLMMGMLGSIYDPNLKSFAQKEEKEQNSSGRMTLQIMDRELKHVDQKFNDIKAELKDINTKIASICDDIVIQKLGQQRAGEFMGEDQP